jgi:hypothetical protein
MAMAKQITSETFRAFINLDNGETLSWDGLTYGQALYRYHWLKRNIVRPLNGPRWKAYGYEMEGKA